MISLEIVDGQAYHQILKEYKYFYNSMQFHELNKNKSNEVLYMLFKGKHYKMGIAGGVSNGILRFPYSAPFAMFEFVSPDVRLRDISDTISLIDGYARERNFSAIEFRLPPSFYDDAGISKVQNCLMNNRYQVKSCDLNYQFYLRDMDTVEEQLQRNARKNLKTAYQYNYEMIYCKTKAERKRAYEVIWLNRKEKGYPLRMTYEQVEDTINLTQYDFFIARLEDVDVAAAIVFQVNKEIYQVIYWGDAGGYSDKRPMNYISAKVCEYYIDKGINILDVGPSTEDGVPNFGLCDFKESIGCQESTKYTFWKEI